MEVTALNLIISGIGVAFTYALFAWGFWLGYQGIVTDHEAHVDFGHAYGAPGTFDPKYRPETAKTADTEEIEEVEEVDLLKAA